MNRASRGLSHVILNGVNLVNTIVPRSTENDLDGAFYMWFNVP